MGNTVSLYKYSTLRKGLRGTTWSIENLFHGLRTRRVKVDGKRYILLHQWDEDSADWELRRSIGRDVDVGELLERALVFAEHQL